MKYIYKYAANGYRELGDLATSASGGGLKTMFKEMSPAAKITLFSALVAPFAAQAANSFVEGVRNYLTRKSIAAKDPIYYQRMLKAHPQLVEADPEQVAAIWSSLYYHAPNLAEDPIAAGAFVRQILQKGLMDDYGGPSVDTYGTLTQIDERLSRHPGRMKQDNKENVQHNTQLLSSIFAKRVMDPNIQEIMNNPELQGNVSESKKIVLDYLKHHGMLQSWLK
ncbi:MAG TPA: hypothetical protein PKN48_00735 [Bacteroidales bacterium]|nr:hypothetical protein [Bacteroidales bacterium]